MIDILTYNQLSDTPPPEEPLSDEEKGAAEVLLNALKQEGIDISELSKEAQESIEANGLGGSSNNNNNKT